MAGFTLLEVIIVVSVVAILSAVALPSFMNMVDGRKVSESANELSLSFVLARSAAIKAGTPVIICASSDGASCSTQWVDGWMAFVDDDRDGVLDAVENVVLNVSNAPNSPAIEVESTAGVSLNSFQFNYRGAPSIPVVATVTERAQSSAVSISAFGKSRRYD